MVELNWTLELLFLFAKFVIAEFFYGCSILMRNWEVCIIFGFVKVYNFEFCLSLFNSKMMGLDALEIALLAI